MPRKKPAKTLEQYQATLEGVTDMDESTELNQKVSDIESEQSQVEQHEQELVIELADIRHLDWSAWRLCEEIKIGTISFNGAIQRGLVWDKYRDSLLIHSMICGIEIGLFQLNETNGKYHGIDGRQRSTAVYRYINNEYPLHAKTPPIKDRYGNFHQIAKKKFDKLPFTMQDRIKSYALKIQYGVDMTKEEQIDLFERINSGKQVTTADKNRVRVLSRDAFLDLTKHDAVSNVIRASTIDKRGDEDVVEEVWILCYNESKSLLQSSKSKILKSVEITTEQTTEIRNVLDYMQVMYQRIMQDKTAFSKMRKNTHFVMLGYLAILAIQNGLSAEEYAEKAIAFFNTSGRTPTTVSAAYNEACESGSAKEEQVRVRMEEIEKSLQ